MKVLQRPRTGSDGPGSGNRTPSGSTPTLKSQSSPSFQGMGTSPTVLKSVLNMAMQDSYYDSRNSPKVFPQQPSPHIHIQPQASIIGPSRGRAPIGPPSKRNTLDSAHHLSSRLENAPHESLLSASHSLHNHPSPPQSAPANPWKRIPQVDRGAVSINVAPRKLPEPPKVRAYGDRRSDYPGPRIWSEDVAAGLHEEYNSSRYGYGTSREDRKRRGSVDRERISKPEKEHTEKSDQPDVKPSKDYVDDADTKTKHAEQEHKSSSKERAKERRERRAKEKAEREARKQKSGGKDTETTTHPEDSEGGSKTSSNRKKERLKQTDQPAAATANGDVEESNKGSKRKSKKKAAKKAAKAPSAASTITVTAEGNARTATISTSTPSTTTSSDPKVVNIAADRVISTGHSNASGRKSGKGQKKERDKQKGKDTPAPVEDSAVEHLTLSNTPTISTTQGSSRPPIITASGGSFRAPIAPPSRTPTISYVGAQPPLFQPSQLEASLRGGRGGMRGGRAVPVSTEPVHSIRYISTGTPSKEETPILNGSSDDSTTKNDTAESNAANGKTARRGGRPGAKSGKKEKLVYRAKQQNESDTNDAPIGEESNPTSPDATSSSSRGGKRGGRGRGRGRGGFRGRGGIQQSL